MNIDVVCNTPDEVLTAQIKANSTRPNQNKWVEQIEAHDGHAVLVGSGPSLADNLEPLRRRKEAGQKVFALNGAAKYLLKQGIVPDAQVIIDPREKTKELIADVEYHFFASQVHPSLFEAKPDAVLFHLNYEEVDEIAKDYPYGYALVGGGSTVGLTALCLAYTLGFRHIHCYGYDSCSEATRNHAEHQPINDSEPMGRARINGKDYIGSITMFRQAELFQPLCDNLIDLGCVVTVEGTGLIPDIVKAGGIHASVLTAVYDLAVSPPTWDSAIFLSEVVKASAKYDAVDIVIQPGPKGGFRDDNLPPDIPERERMLQNIVLPLCRMVPKVRNVKVLKEREPISGPVFPEGWTVTEPVSHYGLMYARHAEPALKAPEWAVRWVKKNYPGKIVTITIRNCDYWPERNSNIDDWGLIRDDLQDAGYKVVWVHDTNSPGATAVSHDQAIRFALYESAILNLGIPNGPFCAAAVFDATCVMFRPITESCKSTSKAFLEAHGIKEGHSLSNRFIYVWAPDDYSVMREFLEDEGFLQKRGKNYGIGI